MILAALFCNQHQAANGYLIALLAQFDVSFAPEGAPVNRKSNQGSIERGTLPTPLVQPYRVAVSLLCAFETASIAL
jgi:hypothetical protein